MERILLSTIVYRTPEAIFPHLESFDDYPRYAEYLERVDRHGDGGGGTRYDLHFRWWKLTYTARSEVTAVEPPRRIEWRLRRGIDARGSWRVEPDPEASPRSEETASRVYFEARFDPHSADADAISLPRFVSIGWVVDRARPKLVEEAERVVSRLVADVEGTSRPVDLEVHETP